MAKILSRQRLEKHFAGDPNGPTVIEVDDNPSNGLGTKSPKKSLAMAPDGLYFKSGDADNDWDKVGSGSGNNISEAIESFAMFAVNTQNDDGGWNFSDPIKSDAIKDRTDLSVDNHYGYTSIALDMIYSCIGKEQYYIESIRDAMEAWTAVAVDPFARFFPDITEFLVKLGGCPGPMCFDTYFAKGKEAADAEINFYKTIERWHDLNPANANPPVGNGADGGLLDLWTNDNAACVAKTLEQAAQRLEDRFKLFRTSGLRIYDLHARIRITCLLSDKGELLNNEDYGLFAKKLANIIKDEIYPTIVNQAFYITSGTAHAVQVFKKYENEAGFAVALSDAVDDLKAMLINDATKTSNGFYAVEDAGAPDTYFSGSKQDQGNTISALIDGGETELAADLVQVMLAYQDESGHFMDFFDVHFSGPFNLEGGGLATPVNVTGGGRYWKLTGDGVKTITVLIGEHNATNPTNQLNLLSGDGNQILKNGDDIEVIPLYVSEACRDVAESLVKAYKAGL